MPAKVGLVLNSPLRDLAGMVLVAKALVESGKECFLIPNNLLLQEGLYLRPDFVLLNYLRTTNEQAVRSFLKSGAVIGVLDQEGGVMPDFEWFRVKLSADAGLRKAVSVFCAWGPYVAEESVAQGCFEESQMSVTGSPRLDFFVNPLRSVALALSAELDHVPRPMVLITTRFSLVNGEFLSRNTQKLGFVSFYGKDPDEVERWQDIQQTALQQMAEMANNLAARLPSVTFVFRPHPFENPKTYEALLRPLPNLRLIRKGAIEGWILRASAVIHRCCSTAIEAGLAGIPAFSPRWIAMPEEIESTERVSLGCSDFEELVAGIQAVAAGKFTIPPGIQEALSETIQRWFHRIDGLAHRRVADRIVEAMAKAPSSAPQYSRQIYSESNYREESSFFRRGLRRLVRLADLPVTVLSRDSISDQSGTRTSWKDSSRGYTVEQVQALLDRVSPPAGRLVASRVHARGLGRGFLLHTVRVSVR